MKASPDRRDSNRARAIRRGSAALRGLLKHFLVWSYRRALRLNAALLEGWANSAAIVCSAPEREMAYGANGGRAA